jgi:uncharacterized protein YbjT (DUF2867 family)
MTTNPILVMGATGQHGNTGGLLVRRLRAEGHPVRVLARNLSERTERLTELGAEVVVGDLTDRRSILPALDDVDLAYFAYPIAAGVVSAASNYAAAVREAGRAPRTVVMSMGPAQPNYPSDLGRAQWLAEQVMEWAGLDLLILRVTAVFHENLRVLHSQSIRDSGVLRNSFGHGKIPWISGRDAAELGLSALLHPERFEANVCYPTGNEEFTHADIADLLTEVLQTPVRYEHVSAAEWRNDLIKLADNGGQPAVNVAMAQHISSVGNMVAARGPAGGPHDPDALRRLLDREPLTLREFIEDNRMAFSGPQ